MNKLTAFSNALACFHYLLSMYPDSVVCFTQWPCEYEIVFHVDLQRFNTDSIVKELNNMRLAGSSLDVSTHIRSDVHFVHIHFPWLV